MSFRKIVPILIALCLAASAFAQGNRGATEVTIKGKKITVDYGRPSLKGRDMFSQMTVGMIWRTGMNQATKVESTGDLVVGGKEVKAGKYSLWTKKTGANTWSLLFHPNADVWGAPPQTQGFVAETPLTMETAGDSAEQLTITLMDNKGKAGIKIQWGAAVLSGSFDVK
ncbi:MAG TPA: DUF2911 domain-containing protein [Blastocatellia bacterium]|nr:DUF2911 domain-containing protein [Blastocatellia bacterium]